MRKLFSHARAEVLPTRILRGLVSIVFVILAFLFGFILWFSLPVFMAEGTQIFSSVWRPEQGQFGILPMVVGSALLAISASILAFPMALGISGFFLLHPHLKTTPLLRQLLRLMAGIPTVVYGLAALFLLIPFLREFFDQGSGFCLLAAVIMVVLLILPVMVMIMDTQLSPLAESIQLTATSLGMNRSQTVLYLVLPNATRGLVSAAILGFSRAMGDTMLPLMLAGNAAQIPGSAFQSIRTLTAHIGLVIATEKGSPAYNSLFAAGLILLLTSLVVTLLTRFLEHRQISTMKGAEA